MQFRHYITLLSKGLQFEGNPQKIFNIHGQFYFVLQILLIYNK